MTRMRPGWRPTKADAGPIRTCVGCRRRRSPEALVRVVADGAGGVAIGRTLPGRGAWLCADDLGCIDRAARKDSLGRALRHSLGPDAYARLRTLVERWADFRPDMRE